MIAVELLVWASMLPGGCSGGLGGGVGAAVTLALAPAKRVGRLFRRRPAWSYISSTMSPEEWPETLGKKGSARKGMYLCDSRPYHQSQGQTSEITDHRSCALRMIFSHEART